MLNWLGVTNKENWEIVKKKNIWGVKSDLKDMIAKIEINDKLIIYIKRNISAFGGIFEIISKPYLNSKMKWDKGDYPSLIKLKPIVIAKDYIPLKEIIPKLTFIKNKQRYSTYFWGKGMRRMIPNEDVEILKKLLK